MNAEGWPTGPQLDLAADQQISGKAFSIPFRVLALALLAGIAWWGYQLLANGKLETSATSGVLWLLAALALMSITVFYIFYSVTTISNNLLRQSWIWNKEMEIADIAYAKLIRLRGFDWLIAPRLYVRTHGGKFASFYATDRTVLQQFEKLSLKINDR